MRLCNFLNGWDELNNPYIISLESMIIQFFLIHVGHWSSDRTIWNHIFSWLSHVNHTAFTTPLNGETVFLEDKYLCIGTVPNVIQCVYNIYI
jgi:hypothetical protein